MTITTARRAITTTGPAHLVRTCDLVDVDGRWMLVEDITIAAWAVLAFHITDPAGAMAQTVRTVHVATNTVVDYRPANNVDVALAGGTRLGGPYVGHTHDLNLTEVGMSDCDHGCKIWRCDKCGVEQVLHSATYGCTNARRVAEGANPNGETA